MEPLTITSLVIAAGATTGALWMARRARAASAPQAEDGGVEVLRAVIEAAPGAMVLLGDTGRVFLANRAARDLFAEGASLEGQNFLALLDRAPKPFRDAMISDDDALFSVTAPDGDADVFRLAKRQLDIGGAPHVLLTVERITKEIRRQEVDVWKKLIRTISHELNNSLAPISSMVHTARVIAETPAQLPKLTRVFDTIEDRTRHLAEFLEGYVRFARLPSPRRQRVDWSELAERVRGAAPGSRVSVTASRPGWVDPTQLEQVVVNLLKNAAESGGRPEDVSLEITDADGEGATLVVSDRGDGMSEEVLASALLPFYSTKERGTGLGLALCREILEAHGGKIRLANREGGGLSVTCTLPGRAEAPARMPSRLTLTRG